MRTDGPKRIIYYKDAANDDFAGTDIQTKTVDETFPFLPKSPFFRFFGWIAYYLVAIPIVHLFCFGFCGFRIRNRKALRTLKKTGYFLYANHTHFSDAFVAPILAFPKRAYVIAGPDVVSIPGIRTLVQMLGAVPIPQSVKAMPLFLQAIEAHAKGGDCVGVFPEAHIWNYCTFLRPMHNASFHYPVAMQLPAVAVAVTYQKRKLPFLRTPRRTLYVSDPIRPDATLPRKEAQEKLTIEIRTFLEEKIAAYSDYAYYEYRPEPDTAE